MSEREEWWMKLWKRFCEWLAWHMPRQMVEFAFWRVWATAIPNEDDRDWEKYNIADVVQLWWFGEIPEEVEPTNDPLAYPYDGPWDDDDECGEEATTSAVYVVTSRDEWGALFVGDRLEACQKWVASYDHPYWTEPIVWQENDDGVWQGGPFFIDRVSVSLEVQDGA